MKGTVSFLPVEQQLSYLKKGLAELIREEDLRERLISRLRYCIAKTSGLV